MDRIYIKCRVFYPGIGFNSKGVVKFVTYNVKELLTVENFEVQPFHVIHARETKPHALRVTVGDHTIAYSGDTEWTDELIKASHNADLFICEGSTYDRPVRNHLSIREVLGHRDRISAKRIVFTHLSEQALEIATATPVEIAADGMVLMSQNISILKCPCVNAILNQYNIVNHE